MVDVLAAVVGVKPQDIERELHHHLLNDGQQVGIGDRLDGDHHLPLRLVVHLVDVIQALGAIEVLSMRMKPGRPWDAGALRTPMVTALVDRVLTSTTRWARYGALLRRLYRWATEIEPRRTNRTSRKASRWRRSTQAVAGIGSHRPARPRRPRCSAERRRVRGRDIA